MLRLRCCCAELSNLDAALRCCCAEHSSLDAVLLCCCAELSKRSLAGFEGLMAKLRA